jgi:hypothetical protein
LCFKESHVHYKYWFIPQMMDIAGMAIHVGGAREGKSFVLKI